MSADDDRRDDDRRDGVDLRVESAADVNKELIAWLKQAYEAA